MSLLTTIARGLRLRPQAAWPLDQWLGQNVDLKNHEFWRALGVAWGGGSWTGRHVSPNAALQLSAAWACVNLIAETIATLPCGVYRAAADGSAQAQLNHPLYNLLHNQPNAEQTAVMYWQAIVASMLLQGKSYSEKTFSRSGAIQSLDFLMPERVERRRINGGRYEYTYNDYITGETRTIPEERMMHIPAFSLDGSCGLPPIIYGQQVFGAAIESGKSSAELFKNSLRSPGLVMMDAVLKKEQREEIRAHVKAVNENGGIMVLEKGAGFQKLTFDPVSTELLSTREYDTEEIARWFRVDPSLIGHGSKDSNWGTGLEQKMIRFVQFTLRPWCVRIEQAIKKDLLTPAERVQGLYGRFTLEGILRGDSASRADFYGKMTQNGIMTRDECRKLENLPVKGGNADELTVQVNMLPLDDLGVVAAPPPEIAQQQARKALATWLDIDYVAGPPAKE